MSETVVGVDIGGTKVLAGLVELNGTTVRTIELPTPLDTSQHVLEVIDDVIDKLRDDGTVGIGLSVLTLVSDVTEELGYAARVPLEGLRLRAHVEGRFGLPVGLENDGNAAALAEHRLGAGRGVDHMIMLVVGTGVGGGLILNGELYRGAGGVAGEFGQVTIDLERRDGRNEPALRRLELLTAGSAIDRRAWEIAQGEPDSDIGRAVFAGAVPDARLLTKLAEDGPGTARHALDEVGFLLGVGVCAFVDIFNPELVVLGGGVFSEGRRLLDSIRRVVSEQVLPPARDVRIEVSRLGSAAGMLGAAIVGFSAAGTLLRTYYLTGEDA